MTFRQKNPTSGYTMSGKPMGQLFCCLPATLVGIIIESDINDARAVTQLTELVGVKMRAQRAGHVGKTRLPQYGIVKQPLDKDHLGAVPDLLPYIQAALSTRQETMSEGRADTAAVEVDDVLALSQREDDAPIESIRALRVDQAGSSQQIEGIALCREMTAQTSSRSVTDAQFSHQGSIMKSALVEIAQRLRVVIQLLLIEVGSLIEHNGGTAFCRGLWIEASEALTEGQTAG